MASWNRDTGNVLDDLLCDAEEVQQYDHDDDPPGEEKQCRL